MSTSVLFDVAGPRTRARHRIYTIVSVVALLALLAFVLLRMASTGQLDYAKWEPFFTPSYISALIWDGVVKTIQMAFSSILLAVVFGLVFGIGKLSDHAWVRRPCWAVVEFFRAVPVLLMMIYIFLTYGAGAGGIGSYWSVVIALTVYNGAVLAEVFRAGIQAVPKGQAEAAYALGLRKSQVMMSVLMPQGVKIMLPAIISQCVVALKDTSLGYVILAPGVTRVGKSIFLEFQNQVQAAIVLAAIYILLNLAVTAVATWAQKKFVGEKTVLVMDGTNTGASDLARGLVRHPEPDDALDDDGAVVAQPAHPDGYVGVVARPLLGVGLGDAGDVADRLGGVAHVHPLGDPALRARHGRLGQRPHGRLEPVADRDHVHRLDVVVHRAPLADRQLGVVRPELDEARPDGAEVRRLEREQPGEEQVALGKAGDLAVERQQLHAPKSITRG